MAYWITEVWIRTSDQAPQLETKLGDQFEDWREVELQNRQTEWANQTPADRE